MGKLRRHLRDNVYGLVAIFIALGGTAYAAVELERNDVTSKYIKDGGVKTKDIGDNAVTSPKVANGSLLGEDFAVGQLPQGPQGPEGVQGVPGPSGATNVIVRSAYLATGSGSAQCNPGETVTGGGVGTDNPADAYVGRSEPTPNSGVPTGWSGYVRQRSTGNASTGSVFVICASP
jgi:hypothetical protein